VNAPRKRGRGKASLVATRSIGFNARRCSPSRPFPPTPTPCPNPPAHDALQRGHISYGTIFSPARASEAAEWKCQKGGEDCAPGSQGEAHPPCALAPMAFTHRFWRSPRTGAAQTSDRPSRDQSRRLGPAGPILPSMELHPVDACRGSRPRSSGRHMQIAPVKGRMRTVEEREVRRAVLATQPPGAAGISVRLFFAYLKRYQPVTGTKSGPLPLWGYRLHTSYSRRGRYTQDAAPGTAPQAEVIV